MIGVRVRTDDEVYRVDAVWLGPPKATFPWRVRYVAWGVGILVFLLTLWALKSIFGFSFFTVAWCLVVTIVITRFVGSKISHERPLTAVMTMWSRELHAPRERGAAQGGAASAAKIRVHGERPRPRLKGRAARQQRAEQRRTEHREQQRRQQQQRGRHQRHSHPGQQPPHQPMRPGPTGGQNVPYAQNIVGRSGQHRNDPQRTGQRAVRRRTARR